MSKKSFSTQRLAIAPMMGYSDRHFHHLMHLLCPSAFLYTEMVTCQQLLHATEGFQSVAKTKKNPIAMQLAGCDPATLVQSVKIVEALGYDEVNLNVGCPSHRVSAARLGACLMKEPALVIDCVAAMVQAVSIPVTVKTRIGVDDQDIEESLSAFINGLAEVGVNAFTLHARKAWLNGLNPKENRHKPPLCYDRVYRLKQERPDLDIIINGGITTVDQAKEQVNHVDGVMIGRAAYQDPYILTAMQRALFPEVLFNISRDEVIGAYGQYVDAQLRDGVPLGRMTRHVLGLYHGQLGARKWRRYLSEHAYLPEQTSRVLKRAMAERCAVMS